jgi:hypothetical protein
MKILNLFSNLFARKKADTPKVVEPPAANPQPAPVVPMPRVRSKQEVVEAVAGKREPRQVPHVSGRSIRPSYYGKSKPHRLPLSSWI